MANAPEHRTKYKRIRFEIIDPVKPTFAKQDELIRRALVQIKKTVGTLELDGAKIWIQDFED